MSSTEKKAIVLLGEIENLLSDLGGTGQGLGTLVRECSQWLPPKLRQELFNLNSERIRVFHDGMHTRNLYDQGLPLFPDGFVDRCQRCRDQLLPECTERLTQAHKWLADQGDKQHCAQ